MTMLMPLLLLLVSQSSLMLETHLIDKEGRSITLEECSREFLFDVKLDGGDLESSDTEDADDCRKKCTKDSKCQYFTFHHGNFNGDGDHDCKLKTSEGPLKTVPEKGAITGCSLKNCRGKVLYPAKTYTLVNEPKSWTDAKTYCEKHHSHLSVMHTEADWNLAKAALAATDSVWIGLRSIYIQNIYTHKWQWSNEEDFFYFSWAKGNNICLHRCAASDGKHWFSLDCDGTLLQYVCQNVTHINGATVKQYILQTDPKTQNGAIEACQSQQMDLASITNKKEQEAFDEVTESLSWFGLTCKKNTDRTIHRSSGEPLNDEINSLNIVGYAITCVTMKADGNLKAENCESPKAFLCNGERRTMDHLTTAVTTNNPPSTETPTTPTQAPTTPATPPTPETPTTTAASETLASSTPPLTSTVPPTTLHAQESCSPVTKGNLHFYEDPLDWVAALRLCIERGGSLVHITNDTVQEEVKLLLTASEPPTIVPELTCFTWEGVNYRGEVATTISGKTCQSWSDQTPHKHDQTPENHPHEGLDNNYCRNPDNERMPWCYTTDSRRRWEFCPVPRCDVAPRPDRSIPEGAWIGMERNIFGWEYPMTWDWVSGAPVDNLEAHRHESFPMDRYNKYCGKITSELKWLDGCCCHKLPFICQGGGH